jgi:hypothetical protein
MTYDSEEIRTLASEENGALNHRLRPLGHTTDIHMTKFQNPNTILCLACRI